MICSHPTLRDESKFVFVPGPADPGSPNIYPRPPLPDFITKELKVIHCAVNLGENSVLSIKVSVAQIYF